MTCVPMDARADLYPVLFSLTWVNPYIAGEGRCQEVDQGGYNSDRAD